jgi:cytoskeletal protein CcmA (bactofilin family)
VVVIGKKGKIRGELKAEKLVVNGEFEGSADCSYVEVLAGGRFIGNVLSKELMIESKAYFQGQSNIRAEERPALMQKEEELDVVDDASKEA